MLEQLDRLVGQFTGEGAYDANPTYQTVMRHRKAAQIVVPPRATEVSRCDSGPPAQRDRHLERIQDEGRLVWQAATGSGQCARVETTMGRYKE
ncbi:putative transposase [Burkholderia oklahomensis]|uniref:Transposase n=1 Tax=Burkholderia oklahomensis TaxID=342113 RepID=A0AAI8FS07_9BURK|nr:putative transposase [Burkholderia oklahomensis]AOI39676.1 transposase [Burkholderia oklahomensis EO147]KUY51606.1 transposase [Burkholderia oklahomensis EO147]